MPACLFGRGFRLVAVAVSGFGSGFAAAAVSGFGLAVAFRRWLLGLILAFQRGFGSTVVVAGSLPVFSGRGGARGV